MFGVFGCAFAFFHCYFRKAGMASAECPAGSECQEYHIAYDKGGSINMTQLQELHNITVEGFCRFTQSLPGRCLYHRKHGLLGCYYMRNLRERGYRWQMWDQWLLQNSQPKLTKKQLLAQCSNICNRKLLQKEGTQKG